MVPWCFDALGETLIGYYDTECADDDRIISDIDHSEYELYISKSI